MFIQRQRAGINFSCRQNQLCRYRLNGQRRILLPVIALVLAVISSPLDATSIAVQPVEEMAERADVIIHAVPKPGASAMMWDASHRYIVTHTTLTVLESFRGNVQAGGEITVRTLGGYIPADDVRMHVSGVPQFKPNEEVVLFLEGQGQILRTIDLSAGKFEVQRNENGLQTVTRRDLADVHIVGEHQDGPSTLKELRTKIVAAGHRKQAQSNRAGTKVGTQSTQVPIVSQAAKEAKRQERTARLNAEKKENK